MGVNGGRISLRGRIAGGLALLFCLGNAAPGARVTLDAGDDVGPLSSFWNGTQSSSGLLQLRAGRELLATLAAGAGRPPVVRLQGVTSSGAQEMNIYHEDVEGLPYYDFAIFDETMDALVAAGGIPFIDLAFTPRALSTASADARDHGAFPPRDLERWHDLVRSIVQHAVERYGASAVERWWWEVWNEPDLPNYWNASEEEYLRLYDHTAAAVKSALPSARVGGPATAETDSLFWAFVDHCHHGRNDRTGEVGAPLDFLSFHAKGGPARLAGRPDFFSPEVVRRLGYPRAHPSLRPLVDRTEAVLERLETLPETRGLPLVLSEADLDWGIGVTTYENPNLDYRNDSYYPVYQLAWIKRAIDLGDRFPENPIALTILGAAQQIPARMFDGQRTLVTADGIELPVINYFRLLGKLGSRRLALRVSGDDAVDGIATRAANGEVAVLLYEFHDDPAVERTTELELVLNGLPAGRWSKRVFRLDAGHANAFTEWKAMGSPRVPSPEQLGRLRSRQGLAESEPAQTLVTAKWHRSRLRLSLPSQGVALIVLSPNAEPEDGVRGSPE